MFFRDSNGSVLHTGDTVMIQGKVIQVTQEGLVVEVGSGSKGKQLIIPADLTLKAGPSDVSVAAREGFYGKGKQA